MAEILQISFEDEHLQRIRELARSVSLDEITFIKMLVAAKVKPKISVRPVGRPPMSPQVKHSKELKLQLDEIYQTLRTGIWATAPEMFERKFSLQIQEYQALAGISDVDGLENFIRNRPWAE